jgi:uncharacterized membrane protein YjgN (DUF898 family)
MNDESHNFEVAPASAFRFTGRWQEFAPIALTNLLLTIVTLGIYRFWARTRERRYLWSRTEFIDDNLAWTGTGLEMFKGFLVVMAILLPAILLLQFAFQAMLVQQQFVLAVAIIASLYLGFIFLGGVARYRALRYRLSRTYWHGIRGGGDPGGWAYGWAFLWKTVVTALLIALFVPWAMTTLWNERWNRMSFGPHRFEAYADTDGLFPRWFFFLATPILIGIVAVFVGFASAGANPLDPQSSARAAMLGAGTVFLGYVLMAFIGLGYWAAFLRKVIGSTELGGLRFSFNARSRDWLMLFLGHVGLVIVTLGVGLIFLSYRNWSFFIRHLEAHGEVDLATLTQSESTAATDAEGLASAFDIGAI